MYSGSVGGGEKKGKRMKLLASIVSGMKAQATLLGGMESRATLMGGMAVSFELTAVPALGRYLEVDKPEIQWVDMWNTVDYNVRSNVNWRVE